MSGGTVLTTQDGNPILTNTGQGIQVAAALSNEDIQFFDYSVNLLQALLWQYNDATNLQALLEQKNDWYFNNQQQFWNEWFNNVFNLATADSFGLMVWSIILGQPTFINVDAAPLDFPAWGFGAYHKNFDNGNFCNTNGSTIQLDPQWARLLLQLHYFQLTSSGTVPETNRMLKYLFANYGDCWLVDNLDMSQVYFFDFQLPAGLLLVLQNFDVLPRPAGVKSIYYDNSYLRWGFGQYHANFDNGGFVGDN